MSRRRKKNDKPTEATETPAKKPTSRRGRGRATAESTAAIEAATPETAPSLLARVPMPVRWRDLDAFNHVNNASYHTYLEEARLHWLQSLPGPWVSEEVAPVLAAVQVNYRRPIEWPAGIVVELFCERVGNSSVTIAHRIIDDSEATTLHADGHAVIVWIDRHGGQATALPDAVREVCSPQ